MTVRTIQTRYYHEDFKEDPFTLLGRTFTVVGEKNPKETFAEIVNQSRALILFLAPFCSQSHFFAEDICYDERLGEAINTFGIKGAILYPNTEDHLKIYGEEGITTVPHARIYSAGRVREEIERARLTKRELMDLINRVGTN
jgi:hypothetical protein